MLAVVVVLAVLVAVAAAGLVGSRRALLRMRRTAPAHATPLEPAEPDRSHPRTDDGELDRVRAELDEVRRQLDAGSDAVRADRSRLTAAEGRLDDERVRLGQERARLDADLARAEQAAADLAVERARLGDEREGLAVERARLGDERERQGEEGGRLGDERERLRGELERVAGLSAAEARAQLVEAVTVDAEREATVLARRIEADARDRAQVRAREIVAQAVQRAAAPTTAELAVATVRLPAEEFKGRIIGREGRNIRAFETVTGVDVVIDDTPALVTLSCFDPRRREVARLTMAALVEDGRIHPQRIEDAYAASLAEVDRVSRRAAEDAMLAAGVHGLDARLVEHLAALHHRTSYGQNVLAHLVESAALAGTMAAELGADLALVTRCAFLHDIGKALTHEVPGSHAIVGAELARRCGESAAVVHAIEAHHDEVAPRTVEAVLTQAADACSGGRPGARRESAAAYADRLRRIEEIAAAQPGVERVFAVQAGHEVRVVVSPDAVDDHAAAQIARTVAKQIEQELTYPGQVRVTVIRETRISEVAH